jgi:trehalose 6-phosphate phosphatase
VADVAEGLQRVCFVGDDVGDLPAFAALDELASAAGVTTVKVAVHSDEAPADLIDGADLVVDGPLGVVDLFSLLLGPPPG